MMVVGGIIGSGIFLNPAIVAQRVGSPVLIMSAWAVGAAVALLGAFVFAELGQRMPATGGGYVYLRETFGRLPAFLYGWALLLAIATGAMAAVAVTFARYAAPLFGLGPEAHTPLAAGAIVLLTIVNAVGVRLGAATQNVFTVLKLGALAALIVAGAASLGMFAGLPTVEAVNHVHPSGFSGVVAAMGTALVPVLFSYGGFQQTNFVAEEIIEPEKNLPRALVVGVAIVAVTYLLANATYLHTLGVSGLAGSSAPAADVMALRFGDTGRNLIAAGIAISTFGFLNLVILVTPRVYQAMAKDGLFFRRLADLSPRYRTPVAALGLQGGWAIVLLLSGSYGALLDWVTFADWIFFGATAACLFVVRNRDRDGNPSRGYRVPFYPWSVIVFILAAAYVVAGSVISNPMNALRGALVLGAGIPVYRIWARNAPRA